MVSGQKIASKNYFKMTKRAIFIGYYLVQVYVVIWSKHVAQHNWSR